MKKYYLMMGILVFAAPAEAASFDCAMARTPRERLICSSVALSDIDDELGRVYRGKRALLSERGGELLQRSEQSWLRYIDVVCPIQNPETKALKTPEQCLTVRFEARLGQLSKIGEKIGPFIFNRVDLFSAKRVPNDDTGGDERGYAVRDIAFPQIDNAQTEAAKLWNKKMERSITASDGDYDFDRTDHTVDYTIGIVSRKIISLSWNEGFYPHGNAHGTGYITNDNFVLSPEPHGLKQDEVFGANVSWSDKIGQLLLDVLHAQGWRATEGQEKEIEDQMREKAARHSEWFFTKDGIEFNFSSYEGGCYACTPREPAIVKWGDLRPFLSPDAVVP